MTINEAIACLTAARDSSPLGGNTVLAVCLVGSGIEYLDVDSLALELDSDGALVLVKCDAGELA
jgi:hypothetical protein